MHFSLCEGYCIVGNRRDILWPVRNFGDMPCFIIVKQVKWVT